jgi:hypothetical protein
VRDAARAWRKAGAIDDAARDAILAAHPDDRRRLGPAFRALVWIFSFVAIHAFFGIVMLGMSGAGGGAIAFFAFAYGLALCAAAEALLSLSRCREMGVESAAAVAGVCYLLGGFAGLLEEGTSHNFPVAVWLLAAAAVCAAAAWQWGYPLAAGLATVFAFALLARVPGGRLWWLLAGPAVAVAAFRLGDSGRLPPSLRQGARAAGVLGLLALYTALHLGSWDAGLVEDLGGRAMTPFLRDGRLRYAAVLATALIPVAVLAAGILTRRRVLIRVGLLFGLASVATLRFYVHVMPLWLALILGGSAALALALVVRRSLHEGRDRERGGFTADPLFDGGTARGVAEMAAVVASLSPAAATPAPASGLEPGGGRYGGGGASGTY